MDLTTPISALSRVGKTTASRLKRLEIETARDLIFYYPFRYDDFSQILSIDQLKAGLTATVCGQVQMIQNRRSPRKRKLLTEAIVSDQSGSVKVIWFNQPWIGKSLKVGETIFLSGKTAGDLFNVYFNSPNWEKAGGSILNTARLVPVYSLTEGLSQKQLRYLVKLALPLTEKVTDYLPAPIIEENNLWPLERALRAIHFPLTAADLKKAKERLAFEEIFLLQIWSQLNKKKLAEELAPALIFFPAKTKQLVNSLNFKLTLDQKKAAWEIIQDLTKSQPMNRLLEGDVGSGKTVVVALALYNVALNKAQSVLMAPTEILAFQHFKTLKKIFAASAVKIGLLTRSQKFIGAEKVSQKEILEQIKKNQVAIVVGTHSLIQKEVIFKKLALIAVDEQHRFGVAQRQALKAKAALAPHFLSLTATPIPRSLALTLYGDLSLSVIKEMPSGRKKIISKLVLPDKRGLAYQFIRKQIEAGRQVFVVCPLIDDKDASGKRSVLAEFEKLDQQVFPDLKIGLLHGRLKGEEKEKVLSEFLAGQIKILVSTAIIEVGVDVPNATVMMIEGADRFGLAQLHQFRGRVGRGSHQSYCFLFSDNLGPEVVNRLHVLVGCNDGFVLAQKDLALRGAGQIYGEHQSGFFNFKIADLSDLTLIKKIKEQAEKFISNYQLAEFPELAKKIESLGLVNHLE